MNARSGRASVWIQRAVQGGAFGRIKQLEYEFAYAVKHGTHRVTKEYVDQWDGFINLSDVQCGHFDLQDLLYRYKNFVQILCTSRSCETGLSITNV